MKKGFQVMVAVFSAALIFATMPLNALAASSATKYVSEVKLAYGKTLSDAEQWLEEQGYEVLDADLNEKADSAFASARAVCLGYKTTTKVEEAITDMKVMNMKGNYSFDAYEMALKEQAEALSVFVKQLTASLNEYRENYEKGLYKAVAAHDLLNKIMDDDTGKTMGDLLLNETVQELGDDAYAALSDEEKANHADMVKILMQGNSQSTLAVEQYLCMASDTADTSFVDRMAEIGSYDAFETAYAKEKNIKSGAELEKAMAADYDDAALVIAEKVDTFKELLNFYAQSEVRDETDEDAIVAYYDKDGETSDYMLFCQARTLYLALSAVEYEHYTLADFFARDDHELKEDDRYLLYPMISALSVGQRACLEYVSLAQLFDNGIMDDAAWKTNYEKIKSEVIDETPTVSAYAGINRDLFKGGVALTNAAKQLNESSDENCMGNWVGSAISNTTYLFVAGFAVNAIATIACRAAAASVKTQMTKLVTKNIQKFVYTMEEGKRKVGYAFLAGDEVDDVTQMFIDGSFTNNSGELLANGYCNTNVMAPLRNNYLLLRYIGNATCILMIVFAAFSLASAWHDVYSYYNTEKTPIPAYMVDEATGTDGADTYTYYSAVTCNRAESGFADEKTALLENYGDLNGDIGKEWLALYVTKDAEAGDPIKAEFLCQKKTNTADGKTALCLFGEKSAQNLLDEKYVYNDECGGLYLFYSVDTPPYTASAITVGTVALMVGAAAAVIAVITVFAVRGKKKKAAATEEATADEA